MKIIVQDLSSTETRVVRHAAMLRDDIEVSMVRFSDLKGCKEALLNGAMPVGSVAFVHEALEVLGTPLPNALSYVKGGESFFHRKIQLSMVSEVTSQKFVKPFETKRFTGFVFDPDVIPSLDCEDRDDWIKFCAMDPDAFVWTSDVVQWLSEWRYYIQDGIVIGSARYDPTGLDDAPEPDMAVVQACMDSLDLPHPYALDMGVLASGETACVEVNDAYSIGLYGRCLKPADYVNFLWVRWGSLISINHC